MIYTSAFNAFGAGTEASAFLAQGTTANIQKYFGLVWDANPAGWNGGQPSPTTGELGQQWIYCSPTGSLAARPASIKTFAQAASESREPDLFELVQAGILQGSLGHATGNLVRDAGTTPPLPGNNAEYGEWERRALAVLDATTEGHRFCHAPELRLGKKPGQEHFHAEPKYQIARIVANMVD